MAFFDTIEEIHANFQDSPFEYGTEDPLVADLYRRLAENVDDVHRPIEFRTDYGDSWRVQEAEEIANEGTGPVSRIRVEPSFVKEGEPWKFRRETSDGTVGSVKRFDIVILDEDPLLMQSKRMGPGNYWDVHNDISVLCEVKHSKNETLSMIFGGDAGLPAKDLKALSDFPGQVENRVLLFFDWWPKTGQGEDRFEDFRQELTDSSYHEGHPVDLLYIPRKGSIERIEDI